MVRVDDRASIAYAAAPARNVRRGVVSPEVLMRSLSLQCHVSEYHSNIKQYQPQSPNITKYHPIHMDISKYHSNMKQYQPQSPIITQYHMDISEYHSNINQYQPQSPNITKYHPISLEYYPILHEYHDDITEYHPISPNITRRSHGYHRIQGRSEFTGVPPPSTTAR